MKHCAKSETKPVHEFAGKASASVSNPAARINKLFKRLIFLVPVGVVGNILYSLAYADRAMMDSVVHFSPAYFVIALSLSIIPLFTGSLRLFIWSRFLGKKVRYRDMFDIAIGAELGAAVSPPVVGGGPTKIWMLTQQGFSGGAALSLTVLESFEDAVFFLVMVPVALSVSSAWGLPLVTNIVAGPRHVSFWILAGVASLGLLAGMLLVRHRSTAITKRFPVLGAIADHIKTFSHQFIETFHAIGQRGKIVFALTMVLTMIQWVCRYSIISVLLLSLDLPARPVLFMALQVIVFALLTLVPTPGGVGGAEALFALIYGSFLPPAAIGLVTAGWRFITFYFVLLLSSAFFFLVRMKPASAEPALSESIRETIHP